MRGRCGISCLATKATHSPSLVLDFYTLLRIEEQSVGGRNLAELRTRCERRLLSCLLTAWPSNCDGMVSASLYVLWRKKATHTPLRAANSRAK